jgi:hypothetical protein
MKKSVVWLLILLLPFCQKKEQNPTTQDWATALLAIYYNVSDECIREYGSISPLGPHYATNVFSGYPTTCETAIIGNSTMDIGRQVPGFYDPLKTNNYGIGGNTACDMLLQMDLILCSPKNVVIASADGNGVLRGISSEVSKKTISKIINKAKAKWNPKIILVGIHPIKLPEANKRKNDVNRLVKELPDCFIDMVSLFGVGENDPPLDSQMADQIHYKEPIYTNLKNRIFSQCGVSL